MHQCKQWHAGVRVCVFGAETSFSDDDHGESRGTVVAAHHPSPSLRLGEFPNGRKALTRRERERVVWRRGTERAPRRSANEETVADVIGRERD